MVAIDTNVFIAQQNNRLTADQQELITVVEEICLPSIVVGELLFGAYNSGRVAANLHRYRQSIDQFPILALDMAAAEEYGLIRMQLKAAGQPIPENDLWIAAICRANDLPLFSLDAHFQRVPGLRLLR